jgi:lysophospholipase L1-like esterase
VTLTGTWANSSNTGSNPLSTNVKVTTHVGDTATVVFTGRALYLLTETYQTRGPFTVTIDGNPVTGDFHCQNSPTAATDSLLSNPGGAYYDRVLVPIASGLTDNVSHTAVLTCAQTTVRSVAGASGLAVDAFIVVSGQQLSPTAGIYVPLGDSWGTGGGQPYFYDFVYPYVVTRALQAALQRSITIQNGCRSGSLYCASAGTGAVGGMSRLFTGDDTWGTAAVNGLYGLLSFSPEFVTILFGANDLRSEASGGSYTANGVSAADYARHVVGTLQFMQDTLDVVGTYGTPVKVAIGTPPYLPPNMLWDSVQTYAGSSTFTIAGLDNVEFAVALTRRVCDRYSWVRCAGIFEAMQYNDSLLIPNANTGQSVYGYNNVTYTTDTGLHPSEPASGLIGEEFASTLLGLTFDQPNYNPNFFAR